MRLFPSGHATEAFLVAYVLGKLMKPLDDRAYPDRSRKTTKDQGWGEQLMRVAARIATNRVVAGVHFPVDSGVGALLGLSLGRYFIARCEETSKNTGRSKSILGWKFKGRRYDDLDFPWEVIWEKFNSDTSNDVLIAKENNTPYLGRRKQALELVSYEGQTNALFWLWDKARKEWKNA